MDLTYLLQDGRIGLYAYGSWQYATGIKQISNLLVSTSKFSEKNSSKLAARPFQVVFTIDHELFITIRHNIAHVVLGFRRGVTVDFLKGHHDIKHYRTPIIEILGPVEGSCIVKRYPPSSPPRNPTGIYITLPESLTLEEVNIEKIASQWLERCGYVLGDIFSIYGPPPKASV